MTALAAVPTAPLTSAPFLDVPELCSLVRDLAADEARWRSLVRFDPTARWWTRLRGDDLVDVWLLSWLPSQQTELHDHGNSVAALTVVQGELDEVRPSPSGRLLSTTLVPGGVRVVPVDTPHDVRNLATTPAISIHAYSPPLRQMTYYRQDAALGLTAVRTELSDEPEARR